MILFLAAAALMVAAALMLALFVFIFPRPPSAKDGREENIAAARARLASLRARRGELSGEDTAEYEIEIKKRLLEEADLPPAAPPDFRPGADKTGIAIICAALIPGALALYLYLGAPFAVIAPPPPHADLVEKIGGLREHIARNPNDAKALALMGRVMSAMGREEEAAEYFLRAVRAIQSGEDSENGESGGENNGKNKGNNNGEISEEK